MEYKVLQPYKDWLLINRGEIRPEVGDKILINNQNRTVKSWHFTENYKRIKYTSITDADIDLCYVEIELPEIVWIESNKNIRKFQDIINQHFEELSAKLAIDFVKQIVFKFHYEGNNEWSHFTTEKFYTTEELYKKFKDEKQ